MRFPRQRTVVDFFREHAGVTPEAIAVKAGTRAMNFITLDRLSNCVANRLLREGLRPEEVVVLGFECSFAYVVAALGTLKAGGAYMPVDLTVPDQRLRYLLTDSGARFALAAPEQTSRFAAWSGTAIALDDNAETLAGESNAAVLSPIQPDHRAYVIYTSGSTGQPKGVEVEHHSLTNLICFFQQCLKLGPKDRSTLIANVAFDASVADLWPCLCAGGGVLVPPRDITTDLDGLIAWLAAQDATYSFLPTALAELILSRPWPERLALRYLGTGGDSLHVRPPGGLPFQFINGYGPTENTVVSTWTVIASDQGDERPSIGRPIGNVKVYILDENGQPVPHGEEGELYLGGEQVARGYLNRPELTAEKFLPDPFAGQPGARMYRTGDWGRRRPDGNLDFIGRKDNQTQIRGRRVELGEIEHELHSHPLVRQACCLPKIQGTAVVGVIAHVATAHANSKLQDNLRKYLIERLPAYMVPADFVFYESLPLTDRGKVDRNALRAIAPAPVLEIEATLPRDTQDRALAELWFGLLPHARSGDINATFKALGGDSLHAVKLLLGVEEITGKRVALSTFFLDPTLPGLCRAARTLQSKEDPQLIVLRREGTRPPLICLYSLSGDVSHLFELARVIGEDQPVYGIRSPALNNPEKLPQSIEEAAQQVTDLLRKISPGKAPLLFGYSWGGLLAFEVARQWVQAGGAAPFVGMVGTPAPLQRFSRARRIKHFVLRFPRRGWRFILDCLTGHRCFPSPGRIFWRLKGRLVGDPVNEPPRMPAWAATPACCHHIMLARKYCPAVGTPIVIDLFREREDYEQHVRLRNPGSELFISLDTSHEPDGGWSRWTGCAPRVHWLNTNHDDVIKPSGVAELATAARMALQKYLDESPSVPDEEFEMAGIPDVRASRGMSLNILRPWNWITASLVGGVTAIALMVSSFVAGSDDTVAMIQNDADVVIVNSDSESVTNPGSGFALKAGDQLHSLDDKGVELQFENLPVQMILHQGAEAMVREIAGKPALIVQKGTVEVNVKDSDNVPDFILRTPHVRATACHSDFTLTVTAGETTLKSKRGEVEITSLHSGKTVQVPDGCLALIPATSHLVVNQPTQSM